VSRFGLVAFASSFDQIGPLTKTVRDAALVLNAIAGHDPQDSTSLDVDPPDFAAQLGNEVRGLRIAIAKEFASEGIDPGVKAAIDAAVAHFSSLGAEIVEVSLPHTEYAVATYYVLATAEASANLARFDGVRYGDRAENPKGLLDHYERTRAEGFGAEVKRRIILGTYVLSSGYYDAYYMRAQKVRELIRRDLARVFEQADVLLSPTSPAPAFKIGAHAADPLQIYLADIFTISANLTGTCAMNVPCGFAASEEGTPLPVGLQLLGRPLEEARLLQVAHAYEQTTGWHKQRPPLAQNASPVSS
jgi:aspartyl-tRNA(Asn)/glutamyl-tRNA(Gln) amidotransferase subunit A